MSPSKVLIPVDGSPASLRALDFVIEMARPSAGASLVLLNVQTISASEATSAAMGSDWQDTASRASAGALEQAVKKCEDGSIRFSTLIKTGLVAEAPPCIDAECRFMARSGPSVGRWQCPLLTLSGHYGDLRLDCRIGA